MTQPALSSATPPPLRLIILIIQHMLVTYAGANAAPLVVADHA